MDTKRVKFYGSSKKSAPVKVDKKIEVPDMPLIVRLELTNTCNLSCPHCRHHSEEKRLPENYAEYYKTESSITNEQVDLIFNEVAEYKPSVTLNVANEPLIAPSFKYAVEVVKGKGLSGTFNSNGIALTPEMSKFLVDEEYDSVNISIDAYTPETLKKARGISTLNKLVRNVERLVEIRGDKKYPRVGVTFVVTDYNSHEVDDFLNFWKERVDVIRLSGYITDKQPDISILPGVSTEVLENRVPCKQIFRDIVIRANGDVTPCVITSEEPSLVMGNIFKDGGIRGVWHGKKFTEWRELHNSGRWDEIPYCKTCDYWIETFDIKEKVEDGFLIRTPSPYTVFYNVIDRMGNWDKDQLHDRQSLGKDESVGQANVLQTYKKIANIHK